MAGKFVLLENPPFAADFPANGQQLCSQHLSILLRVHAATHDMQLALSILSESSPGHDGAATHLPLSKNTRLTSQVVPE
jgi:hypothetical protein